MSENISAGRVQIKSTGNNVYVASVSELQYFAVYTNRSSIISDDIGTWWILSTVFSRQNFIQTSLPPNFSAT